jgi:anti-sigma factor RsiW
VLTCYLTRRRLGALVDGALDGRQESVAASHVAGCGRCRREVDELRQLRVLVRRGLGGVAAPEWSGFWAGVVRGIEDRPPVPAPARRSATPLSWVRLRPRVALGGAAAAVALVSLAVWQFWGSPAPIESSVIVRSANTEMPDASVMVYSPPEQDMAVIWVLAQDDLGP